MSPATFDVLREHVARDHGRDPATLTPDTPLSELAMDSLALIELLFTLEEHFGVAANDVPDDLPTLGSVAAYIDGLVAARDGAATGSNAQ